MIVTDFGRVFMCPLPVLLRRIPRCGSGWSHSGHRGGASSCPCTVPEPVDLEV